MGRIVRKVLVENTEFLLRGKSDTSEFPFTANQHETMTFQYLLQNDNSEIFYFGTIRDPFSKSFISVKD